MHRYIYMPYYLDPSIRHQQRFRVAHIEKIRPRKSTTQPMSLRGYSLPLSNDDAQAKRDDDYDSKLKPKSRYGASLGFLNTLRAAQHKLIYLASRYKLITLAVILLVFLLQFTSLEVPFLPSLFKSNDPKVVIILAANEGGGVLKWKLPQEWLVERSLIANKKQYAKKHGYALTIKDMTIKKRYSHEWRELWEKVDILKQTMRQYPKTEWFWWLDLHTYIMEPQISLEAHFLNNLENLTYRSLETFNPLLLPVDTPYTDYTSPIDLIITQDCGGFNLGSFLMRRLDWSEMLLDMWWDPAMYEQMHMKWEHKEQDALETLYTTQPWIRERVGFLPLRKINAFPPGACSEQADDPQFFFKNNDFVVNMAGCEYGRDCWKEMEHYKALSKLLHKPWWKLW